MYFTTNIIGLQLLAVQALAAIPGSESVHDQLLPFSPLRVVFLVGWIYLCIYTVVRVEYSPLISEKYRPLASVVSLLFGPFLMFLLTVTDITSKLQEGEITPDDIFRKVIGDLLHWEKRSTVKEAKYIELLDTSGRTFKEVYGGESKDPETGKKTLDKTERIIFEAIKNRASDILIDPIADSFYTIRFRIDGFLRTQEQIDAEKCVAVINSVKAISKMDIAEKRRPQDGSFMAKTRDANIYFRVASAGVMGRAASIARAHNLLVNGSPIIREIVNSPVRHPGAGSGAPYGSRRNISDVLRPLIDLFILVRSLRRRSPVDIYAKSGV